jgi:hypothetical protein|eukprot:COSAG03_NODE_100_length_12949_cov_130.139611_9_plen_49_part_00
MVRHSVCSGLVDATCCPPDSSRCVLSGLTNPAWSLAPGHPVSRLKKRF